MNDFIQMMRSRRTIRRYQPTQIAENELNAILDAGLHAPSASGRQAAIIVVSQNAALNDELGGINRTVFALPPNATVSKEQPSIIDDATIKSAFYGAPTVLILFAEKDKYNLTGDCFVAAENIVIAAHSLGIGSCIVARAAETFGTERGREIQKEWGIGDEYEARVCVTLGYMEGSAPAYKPRKENRIVRV